MGVWDSLRQETTNKRTYEGTIHGVVVGVECGTGSGWRDVTVISKIMGST